MKRIARAVCLILAVGMMTLLFAGCEKKPGLYAWYGGKMNVKDVLTITVDMGGEPKAYAVPFDTYRTVFVYLKGIVSNSSVDGEGNSKMVSKEEQTVAVKEVTEDILTEYYSLVALGEKYGISITEEDREMFRKDHLDKIYSYVEEIEAKGIPYKGTKEEYAMEMYRKTLKVANGMTPEYLEFTYYKNLLEKRLKLLICTDLDSYLAQNYCHFKQVLVSYTKGDPISEQAARAAIDEAYGKLQKGGDIDALAKEYGTAGTLSDVFFDGYGYIVGSRTQDSVNDITANAVRALSEGEVGEVLTGDVDGQTGYFAVMKRLPIEKEFVCGEDAVGKAMLESAYVGASSYSPIYDRYSSLKDSYMENTICVPVDGKVYGRIAVNTLY